MNRYRKYVNLFVFIIILALVFDPVTNNHIPVSSGVVNKHDSLYQEIQDKSGEFSEESQNAYIDRVWKKTPGRNGLKVNVDESYKKMQPEGTFEESLLVYDQVPPEVTFSELPAAPVYRGHPEKEMVSLLINVSWGEEHIPEILDTLNEHEVKATFFVEGNWAKNNAELVKMIDEQGHVIGNHGLNHPDMARLNEAEINHQIKRTNEILNAITEETPKWFAPPSGSFHDQVVEISHQLEMETVLWTVDTIDWKNPSESVMVNRINERIHPGATILMHPTPSIASGLDAIIETLKNQDYRIGTIEQLLSEKR